MRAQLIGRDVTLRPNWLSATFDTAGEIDEESYDANPVIRRRQ
jgi:hypothetical protein